jgi:hypothetical protein
MALHLEPEVARQRLNDVLVAAHDEVVRGVRMGDTCVLHVHEEWVPMEDHHVWPLGMGGPNAKDNLIRVCANGHYSIHAYFDHLITYGAGVSDGMDDVPIQTKRHFGPKVRQFARLGWSRAGRPRRGRSTDEES